MPTVGICVVLFPCVAHARGSDVSDALAVVLVMLEVDAVWAGLATLPLRLVQLICTTKC